jgi:hypothetical protein
MRKRKQYLWEVSRIGGSSAKFIDENQGREALPGCKCRRCQL